jgi:hypothetical protein
MMLAREAGVSTVSAGPAREPLLSAVPLDAILQAVVTKLAIDARYFAQKQVRASKLPKTRRVLYCVRCCAAWDVTVFCMQMTR